jgi:hypothetical protein
MMDVEAFAEGLALERQRVFQAHPELTDHREEFPWLTGSLGDPFARVWFVAENPSLTQVRRAGGRTADQQWSVSRGDKLLRNALYRHGFKTGDPLSPGGWRCYITDVIKSADVVREWRANSGEVQRTVAEWWAPVLTYELVQGQPEYLVALGTKADKLPTHLEDGALIPALPPRRRIYHYSFVGCGPSATTRRRAARVGSPVIRNVSPSGKRRSQQSLTNTRHEYWTGERRLPPRYSGRSLVLFRYEKVPTRSWAVVSFRYEKIPECKS